MAVHPDARAHPPLLLQDALRTRCSTSTTTRRLLRSRCTPIGVDGAPHEIAREPKRNPRLRHATAFDSPHPPAGVPRDEIVEEAVGLTTHRRTIQRGSRSGRPALAGIAQGASDPDLRTRSIEEIAALGTSTVTPGGGGQSRDRCSTRPWAGAAAARRQPGLHGERRSPEGSRADGAGIDCSTASPDPNRR
jgi:hypothetical protein